MLVKNLILSGGQIKGISYIGVFKAMEELKILDDVENILGVSSGAVFGFILAIGLKSDQMIKLLDGITLNDLIDIKTENFFNFLQYYGLDSGDKWCKLFKTVCKKILGIENATFRDLKDKVPKYNLIIVATNVTKKTLDQFSVDTTPDMPIWLAIRLSISVPVYFNTIYYNNCCYVDGGILDNYPISLFDNDIEHTLGIVLTDPDIGREVTNIGVYMYKVLDCVMCTMQNYLKTKYEKNTIELFVEYNLLEFRFDSKIKNDLVNKGYINFKEQFLERFNSENNEKSSDKSLDENRSNENYSDDNSNNENTISEQNIEDVISDIRDIISTDSNIDRIVNDL